MCTLSTNLMDSGMEFQMTGPATEKTLSPSLVFVLGRALPEFGRLVRYRSTEPTS